MAKSGRTFLRGITSEKYGLSEFREAQLKAPRVRNDEVVVDDAKVGHSGDSKDSRTWWRVGPGDDPFLTQTLQVHFVEIPPGKSNHGHGHQNEAAFYILRGKGYEIHDGQRYDWEKDDLVIVHTDSVHRHFNDGDETATALVFKAKSMWMYFGLIQQGRSGPVKDEHRFGPREDWSRIWTPGVMDRKKVVKPADTTWETTQDGIIRSILSPARDDVRCFSVDIYQQRIPAGSRSGKAWHMADEVLYVQSGSGTSYHWEVEAEIADKYYARIAKEPTVHRFTAGDTIYVPQNTVHQHVADDGSEVMLLSAQNRLFRHLGYDTVAYLENAPEFDAARS
ncbi:cupin domain-containing protein [Actinomadura sp. SCN-SB]|uniref:cupin domain-containing protein n=1 Tax=Actinomadura sp. SCN-SB TaxID=3373092 RepID=UPI0037514950